MSAELQDALREYVEEEGLPASWPNSLKRACRKGRWDLAVYLEQRMWKRTLAHAGLTTVDDRMVETITDRRRLAEDIVAVLEAAPC